MLVEVQRPNVERFTIERTMPDPPRVLNSVGEVTNLTVGQLLPGLTVFGQHEIAEVTRNPSALTALIERFAPAFSPAHDQADLEVQLERSRVDLIRNSTASARLSERLAALPGLREQLKLYVDAGLETKLREKALMDREDIVLRQYRERLTAARGLSESLRTALPFERRFLSDEALEPLPSMGNLVSLLRGLDLVEESVGRAASIIETALDEATAIEAAVVTACSERKEATHQAYLRILRELQSSKIDGQEFIRLGGMIDELALLVPEAERLAVEKTTLTSRRRSLVHEWQEAGAVRHRGVANAAESISKALESQVRIEVDYVVDEERLLSLLRELGLRTPQLPRCTDGAPLSVADLADRQLRCRL